MNAVLTILLVSTALATIGVGNAAPSTELSKLIIQALEELSQANSANAMQNQGSTVMRQSPDSGKDFKPPEDHRVPLPEPEAEELQNHRATAVMQQVLHGIVDVPSYSGTMVKVEKWFHGVNGPNGEYSYLQYMYAIIT